MKDMGKSMNENINKKDICSYNYEELIEEMKSIGEKAFRGRQIYEWLHVKLADDFQEMTNLSKALREKLEAAYEIRKVRVECHQISKVDPTEKFLFELEDGNMVESVLMKYNYGNSVCISSQVGCRMGCRFCASTIGGLERNLEPSEMLRQIYQIQKISGERVSNVVVMGTGEPLDNYENFLKFIHMLSDEHGLHISQRNITASTCGVVPNMRRLAEEGLQITLALSLHGSSQRKRESLMPIAKRYELTEVLDACDYYFEKTGRRITFEYSLVAGVNDRPEDAEELTAILKKRNCHLNLIPVNPIKERDFKKPDRKNALEFKNKLEKNGINVTIRRERGSDIDGACGQLRRRHAITGKGEVHEDICND
jgi:23S rRNA (adenine2503-C2)-methyltransferase